MPKPNKAANKAIEAIRRTAKSHGSTKSRAIPIHIMPVPFPVGAVKNGLSKLRKAVKKARK